MSALFILNDPPYGTERCYNALRLARAMLDKGETGLRVFLLGDAAVCASGGQKVPQGYYNLADMLGSVLRRGAEVAACGTCMDARGIASERLVDGVVRGTMDQLATWSREAGRVFVF